MGMEARERMGRLSEVHQHWTEHDAGGEEHGGGHSEHGGHGGHEEHGFSLHRWLGVIVAAITLLAGLATILQNDAGVHEATFRRLSQQLSIEAMGERTSGQAVVNYAAYNQQTRVELSALSASAEQNNDPAKAKLYDTISNRIAALSPIATAPYSDDVALYESDVYLVKSTDMEEHATAYQEVYEGWESKSHTYILLLTILAVALALFGLATTVNRLGRRILVTTSSVLVGVVVVWIALVYFKPVETVPDGAIAAYARGVGLAYQGKNEDAIKAYEEAVAKAPEYASAHFEQGNEQMGLGKYQEAIDAYKEASSSGRDNANVAWNSGWASYLLGNFNESISTDRHALALNGDLLTVRFNLALSLLASGQVDEAKKEYAATMDEAAKEVASAKSAGTQVAESFWSDLDASREDVDALAMTAAGNAPEWAPAPPKDKIGKPDEVKTAAEDLSRQLSELDVALEQTGAPPSGTASAQISQFKLASSAEGTAAQDAPPDLAHQDQTIQPTVGLDSGTYTVTNEFKCCDYTVVNVFFDYSGMHNGQQVVWKVNYDGQEDTSYRRVESWSLGDSGTALKPITLVFADPGDYQISLYVDSHLVQTGTFSYKQP